MTPVCVLLIHQFIVYSLALPLLVSFKHPLTFSHCSYQMGAFSQLNDADEGNTRFLPMKCVEAISWRSFEAIATCRLLQICFAFHIKSVPALTTMLMNLIVTRRYFSYGFRPSRLLFEYCAQYCGGSILTSMLCL